MEINGYFDIEALPACLKQIGDKINLLRCSNIRTIVNDKLRESEYEGVCVQFDVDDYDQIVACFYEAGEYVGDMFVIRSMTLKTLVERINDVYNKRFNKSKTMNEKNCEVTTVTSENQSDSNEAKVLRDYILQHFRGVGYLCELDKMGALNVSILCRKATAGAVESICFDDESFTVSIKCNVSGLNEVNLGKKVDSILQAAIECSQVSTSKEAEVSSRTIKEDAVGKKTAVSQESVQPFRTAKEDVTIEDTISSLGSDINVNDDRSEDKNLNALRRYNDSVEQDINRLENELKNYSYRACGQRIRGYLLKKARASGIHVEDTSTEWLVSPLDVKKKELLCTLYECLDHQLPPFLHPCISSNEASEKITMRI